MYVCFRTKFLIGMSPTSEQIARENVILRMFCHKQTAEIMKDKFATKLVLEGLNDANESDILN